MKVRDVTIEAADAAHIERIVEAVRDVEGVEVEHVSDRTFLLHLGGKLESSRRRRSRRATTSRWPTRRAWRGSAARSRMTPRRSGT